MKKVLIATASVITLTAVIGSTYYLNKEKIYTTKEIKCDFDAGMCYDLKGKPITGRIKNYDKDILISDIEYKDGKEDGELRIYKNDGKLFLEGLYKEGKPNGVVKEYNEDGSLLSYDEFKDGLLHGRSIIYFAPNKILKEWNYNMGKETGTGKVYYQNGNPQLEINFTSGELKYFYEEGSVQTFAHFDDTGYNGLWTIYQKDGSVKAELTYDKGVGTTGYCIKEDGSKHEFTQEDFTSFAQTNLTPCDTPQTTNE